MGANWLDYFSSNTGPYSHVAIAEESNGPDKGRSGSNSSPMTSAYPPSGASSQASSPRPQPTLVASPHKGSRSDLQTLLLKMYEGTRSTTEKNTPADDFCRIYEAANITAPKHGFTILKVAEMLRSEHLRDQSFEAKHAAISLVFEMTGAKFAEVVEDAAQRRAAIAEYESQRRRRVEDLEARKDRQNRELHAEMQAIVDRYRASILANQNEVAEEKIHLNEWRTRRDVEEKRILETLSYCNNQRSSRSAISDGQTSHPRSSGSASNEGNART